MTIFTIGNEGLETLSTFIYADARKGGLTPELRPLSTIIFVTVLVLLIVINKRAEKAKRALNENEEIYIDFVCFGPAYGGCSLLAGRSDEERSKILKIYNWGDYIDEDVLTDFPKWYKEQTGEEVRIIYQVFDYQRDHVDQDRTGA